jgi:hypothetical protein
MHAGAAIEFLGMGEGAFLGGNIHVNNMASK